MAGAADVRTGGVVAGAAGRVVAGAADERPGRVVAGAADRGVDGRMP